MTSESEIIKDIFTTKEKCLTDEEKQSLQEQNKRLLSSFKIQQLETNARKHWDIFYKRNETRFFKDRHWTTREFEELLSENTMDHSPSTTRHLLEVGCGVGNLIFPLIDELGSSNNYFFYACDFSPRAIEFVCNNPLYNEQIMRAFQCDITTTQLLEEIPKASLDIVTMVFVLSAIHPQHFKNVLQNLGNLLKPGGLVLFRDYGLYDTAQLRFKAGHKISENFYMRQDGTRSYFFSAQELMDLFTESGFSIDKCGYVQRRTLNIMEGIDVPRIFLQGKFRKPTISELENN